jgi:hypothetical protein
MKDACVSWIVSKAFPHEGKSLTRRPPENHIDLAAFDSRMFEQFGTADATSVFTHDVCIRKVVLMDRRVYRVELHSDRYVETRGLESKR